MFARAAARTLRLTARPQFLARQTAPPLMPRRRLLHEDVRQPVPKKWGKNQTMAVVAFVLASSGIGIALWGYTSYLRFVEQTMHNYPAPVAKELRRGLYHSMYDQPQRAVAHFRAALERCAELGMDPLADEVTGIKIELAALMEKHGLHDKTITILEHVLDEVAVGAEARRGAERTRLLRRGVAVGLKLGELFMALERPKEAEEPLVWAVQTMLRERRRREGRGAGTEAEDEGEWLSDEEAGMALENLAGYYMAREQHFLATPLYLQALELLPPGNCHAVVLMNNLSTSLAQQPIPPGAPITRHQLIADSAVPWARKALQLCGEIAPPARTDECDSGCVAATYNLGEFAEMLGDRGEARRRYGEAMSLARGLGMRGGVERARVALGRLADA